MKLIYRIQHLAGRDEPLARLLKGLPPAVQVVTDHDRETLGANPLRNYLRCLEDPDDKNVTHVAVIQDDAVPCVSFSGRVREAIGEKPDEVISMFVGGLPSRTRKDFWQAMKNGERWCPVYFREIHHVVGLVWPVAAAAEFLEFAQTTRFPGATIPRSDDAAVGYWARKTRRLVWATVPCLLEHPDDVPSTIHSIGRQGDAGRRAIAFADDM